MSYNEALIKKAVSEKTPIVYKVDYVGNVEDATFTKTLVQFLSELKKNYLTEICVYVLRELYTNADRCNLKRAHFYHYNLDINKSLDYKNGMRTFAKEYSSNTENYREILKTNVPSYVKVIYLVHNNHLILAVKNNHLPTDEERKRIEERIQYSKTIHDLVELYKNPKIDSSEGAGMGIMMTMVMLRSLGVPDSNFRYSYSEENKETTAQVTIPMDSIPKEQEQVISKKIADSIDSIPSLPDSIIRLQEMLKEGEASFSLVASLIQKDPSLTASLLKIVNSAQYMLHRKMSNIQSACSLMGLKGLKTLLTSYGVQKTLQDKYGAMDSLWRHAYLCANFSRHLSVILNHPELAEDAHVAGILHDIGRIVLLQTESTLTKEIERYMDQQGIGGDVIERLTVGVSHAKIGFVIASKWNFPEHIKASIENHHQPLLVAKEHQVICDIVYLANLYCHKISGDKFDFFIVDDDVLKRNGIHGEEEFNKIYNELFEKHQKSLKQD